MRQNDMTSVTMVTAYTSSVKTDNSSLPGFLSSTCTIIMFNQTGRMTGFCLLFKSCPVNCCYFSIGS